MTRRTTNPEHDVPSPNTAFELLQLEASTLIYNLDYSVSSEGKTVVKSGKRFHRICHAEMNSSTEVITDRFEDGSVCKFIRLSIQEKDQLLLLLPGEYDLMTRRGSGWIFRSRDSNMPCYWVPVQPVARSSDNFGRIRDEKILSIIQTNILKDNAYALFKMPADMLSIDIVIWTLLPDSLLYDELMSLSSQEQQDIYLWGSHTRYTGPKDLYQNLIHGAIYKNGWRWPPRPWKTAYCEADAHALYVAFHSLWKATQKNIYQLMKTQLVFSVIARQDENGAWQHGLWTDEFEVQYRLHCSGIHMLAADYEVTKDPIVFTSLQKAVDYLKDQCEELSVGTWYLHDSLELNISGMKHSPLTFQESRALGKSPSNMLVLNTHLDALVALSRFVEVSGQNYLEDKITSGVNSTIAVLNLKPAEIFYRLLFYAIELTFIPSSVSIKLPLYLRIIRRLARQNLIPLLPRIKKYFPRLVMPNGYIDRNLTLDEFTFHYFPINVMDLLRFQRRFSIKMIDAVIDKAIDFIQRVGLSRWLDDNEGAEYAIGFWAEAMYLACLHQPGRRRALLAETVIALIVTGQGLPPSLLGCNPEFIPLKNQAPYLWTDNEQVRVINLSVDPDHLEFLFVNGSDSPQEVKIPRDRNTWSVFDKDGKSISNEEILAIPPKSWIRLLSSP